MKKLILSGVVASLLTIGILLQLGAWDNTKPADNQLWNTAALSIRSNWDALEVELGVDIAGAHPYFQATQPTKKPDTSTNLDSTDLGRIWIDSDDNKMYAFTAVTPTWTPYPTAGSTNTWAGIQTFSVAAVWTLGVVPNNTYITATDNAGTGAADLIKANTSDLAVLADGAVLAAATESGDGDRTIADKKYVDDEITNAKSLGTWDTNPSGYATSVTATTDGFVCAISGSIGSTYALRGYTPIATLRAQSGEAAGDNGKMGSIMMPVKSGDTWKVTGATTVFWIPLS